MNAQVKIAGHGPEPLGHGSARVDPPSGVPTPGPHAAATAIDDDEARISDWAEEGGAVRSEGDAETA